MPQIHPRYVWRVFALIFDSRMLKLLNSKCNSKSPLQCDRALKICHSRRWWTWASCQMCPHTGCSWRGTSRWRMDSVSSCAPSSRTSSSPSSQGWGTPDKRKPWVFQTLVWLYRAGSHMCIKGKSRVAFDVVKLYYNTGHVLAAWDPDLDVWVRHSSHVHRGQLHGLAHSHREGLNRGKRILVTAGQYQRMIWWGNICGGGIDVQG